MYHHYYTGHGGYESNLIHNRESSCEKQWVKMCDVLAKYMDNVDPREAGFVKNVDRYIWILSEHPCWLASYFVNIAGGGAKPLLLFSIVIVIFLDFLNKK